MHRDEWQKSIAEGRLSRKRDWVNDLSGVWLVSCIWISIVFLLLQGNDGSSNRNILIGVISSFGPIYAIRCLRRENDLVAVETSLEAHENRQLIISAFQTLGWRVRRNNQYIVTADTKGKWWQGVGQTVTILIADKKVYMNVLHGSGARGRWPFYFGLNQRKLAQAVAAIKSVQPLPSSELN